MEGTEYARRALGREGEGLRGQNKEDGRMKKGRAEKTDYENKVGDTEREG